MVVAGRDEALVEAGERRDRLHRRRHRIAARDRAVEDRAGTVGVAVADERLVALLVIGFVKIDGSNVGNEPIASIAPSRGSIATNAPGFAPGFSGPAIAFAPSSSQAEIQRQPQALAGHRL